MSRAVLIALLLTACLPPMPVPRSADCARECLSLRYQCVTAGELGCRDVQVTCLGACE